MFPSEAVPAVCYEQGLGLLRASNPKDLWVRVPRPPLTEDETDGSERALCAARKTPIRDCALPHSPFRDLAIPRPIDTSFAFVRNRHSAFEITDVSACRVKT